MLSMWHKIRHFRCQKIYFYVAIFAKTTTSYCCHVFKLRRKKKKRNQASLYIFYTLCLPSLSQIVISCLQIRYLRKRIDLAIFFIAMLSSKVHKQSRNYKKEIIIFPFRVCTLHHTFCIAFIRLVRRYLTSQRGLDRSI